MRDGITAEAKAYGEGGETIFLRAREGTIGYGNVVWAETQSGREIVNGASRKSIHDAIHKFLLKSRGLVFSEPLNVRMDAERARWENSKQAKPESAPASEKFSLKRIFSKLDMF